MHRRSLGVDPKSIGPATQRASVLIGRLLHPAN
jgi:hypothetical protein